MAILLGLFIFHEVPMSKQYGMDMGVSTRTLQFGINLTKKNI